jgi:hypothetical protein
MIRYIIIKPTKTDQNGTEENFPQILLAMPYDSDHTTIKAQNLFHLCDEVNTRYNYRYQYMAVQPI